MQHTSPALLGVGGVLLGRCRERGLHQQNGLTRVVRNHLARDAFLELPAVYEGSISSTEGEWVAKGSQGHPLSKARLVGLRRSEQRARQAMREVGVLLRCLEHR